MEIDNLVQIITNKIMKDIEGYNGNDSFSSKHKTDTDNGLKDLINKVLEEIKKCLENINENCIEEVQKAIANTHRIFVVGVGRSGFCCKGFAMRLMHLGFDTYFIGETVTPSFSDRDLLIIGSGSGETASLAEYAKKAKEKSGKLILFTINPESKIGKLADIIIKLDAPSPKINANSQNVSIQPMGSMFEQSLLILFDVIIMLLMKRLNISESKMFSRHANLE